MVNVVRQLRRKWQQKPYARCFRQGGQTRKLFALIPLITPQRLTCILPPFQSTTLQTFGWCQDRSAMFPRPPAGYRSRSTSSTKTAQPHPQSSLLGTDGAAASVVWFLANSDIASTFNCLGAGVIQRRGHAFHSLSHTANAQ